MKCPVKFDGTFCGGVGVTGMVLTRYKSKVELRRMGVAQGIMYMRDYYLWDTAATKVLKYKQGGLI